MRTLFRMGRSAWARLFGRLSVVFRYRRRVPREHFVAQAFARLFA